MIRKLSLQSFKGFREYSVSFRDSAVVVGPNNAGKTTLISALKTAGLMLDWASRYRPQGSADCDGPIPVHYFTPEQFGFEDENVRFDFLEVEASFAVTLERQMQIRAVWPAESDEDPFFYLMSAGGVVLEKPAVVKAEFPSIGVVPAVVPLEQRERILTDDYIRKNLGGRLSSRHFRNQLLLAMEQDSADLQGYYDLVSEWLPELSLELPRPQRNLDQSSVELFYSEGRRPREVAWAGDGLQVFLQLLWHIHRLRSKSTIVLDEPEVYLHPDLQRRLIQLLVFSGQQFILATHSPEIVAETPHDALIWVDRSRATARRIEDDSAMAHLSSSIGSTFNLGLARVLRAKAAVFIEGADTTVLRRLAEPCGFGSLAREHEIAFVPLGRISRSSVLDGIAWLAHEFLGDAVHGYVVLDRGYRSDDECRILKEEIRSLDLGCHIWRLHELEDYLLIPSAIARLSGVSHEAAAQMLDAALELMKEEVFAGLIGARSQPLRQQGLSDEAVARLCQAELDEKWQRPRTRLTLCSGKGALTALNGLLLAAGNRPLTAQRLSMSMGPDEVSDEMKAVLEDIQLLAGEST